MTETNEPKRKRERSPSYPAISLGPAVEKAKDLYQVERSYLAPIDTILKDWGYAPKSGAGLVVVAALLKFGLLEDEGSGPARKARITEFGQRIIRDTREESPDRARLLREAALRPQIHRELWDRFGGELPSDSNLHATMIFEFGFTDGGAKEFIREYKDTIAYARLTDDDDDHSASPTSYPVAPSASEITAASVPSHAGFPTVVRRPATAGVPAPIVLPLPIATSMDRWPSLVLPYRLTKAEWDSMKTLLNAMENGIVEQTAVQAGAAQGSGAAFDASVEVEESGDA